MTDYGHDLLFGTFITPTAALPERVVELARASETAGLDLVTFQDHPYQPRFLDTWTLLAYVAARTETIHLAANVTNLPLRPPAVLARAVASLDLLSGGRVELGLGAGAFWDAIAAMGRRPSTSSAARGTPPTARVSPWTGGTTASTARSGGRRRRTPSRSGWAR